MELQSITRDREDVFAENVTVANGKVTGRLVSRDPEHGSVWREKFTVSLKSNNRFSVDIGTGSGIKVAFEVP